MYLLPLLLLLVTCSVKQLNRILARKDFRPRRENRLSISKRSTVFREAYEGKCVAIKEVEIPFGGDSKLWNSVINEMAILNETGEDKNAPSCLIRMTDIYHRSSVSDALAIVMELVDGVDLNQVILQWQESLESPAPANQRVIGRILRDVLRGVDYLHGRNILHRKIRPENIMVCRRTGNVKLVDFGMAIETEQLLEGPKLPLEYASPELMQSLPYGKPYDVWSIGATAFRLQTGKVPWDLIPTQRQKRIADGTTSFVEVNNFLAGVISRHLSGPCATLIRDCLNMEAGMRPTAAQLLQYECVSERMVATDEEMMSLVKEYDDSWAKSRKQSPIGKLEALCTGKSLEPTKIDRQGSGFVEYRGTLNDKEVIVKVQEVSIVQDEGFPLRINPLINEVSVMRRISLNPAAPDCLVRLKDAFRVTLGPSEMRIGLVMERVEGTSLEDILKAHEGRGTYTFSGPMVRRVLKSVLEGLNFMHQNGMVHRGITPSNIRICRATGKVKLMRYDLAIDVSSNPVDKRFVLEYASPEALVGKSHGSPNDIWMLAALAFKMETGIVPLELLGRSFRDIKASLWDSEFKDYLDEAMIPKIAPRLTVRDSLANLIKDSLKIDPDERPTAAKLLTYDCFKNDQIATDEEMMG